VTIRTSFSDPYDLNIPSSSSLVEAKGKPEHKRWKSYFPCIIKVEVKVKIR
jgi:hypothetical protein